MKTLLPIAFAAALSISGVATAEDAPSAPADQSWWTPWYIVDYGLIAAGAGTYLIAGQMGPTAAARLGPQYDPNDPTAVLAPEFSDRIGRIYAEEGQGETVPVAHAMAIAGGAGGALIIEEGLQYFLGHDPTPQRFHDTVVGYLEATALTAGTTEFAKVFVGRLRPDFQDRATRHLCNTSPPADLDCTGYEGRPLSDDPVEAEHIFVDGRKSFWSGHSAFAFSTLTYMALATGGRWVWGAESTPLSRALGITLQTAFMTTAAFIAGSRLDDGRHHVTDVVVGSAVGLGIANFSYWRRFDGDGNAVRGRAKVQVAPGPSAGLTVTWTP